MKKAKDIMTVNPICCTPETNLKEVASMMCDHDCGEIPVVENLQNLKPSGAITDRDIVCRSVALGKNPLDMEARDCMTSPCIFVNLNTSIDECCELMERYRIRRLPVVDEKGACCGIIAQADLLIRASEKKAARLVKEVSQPQKSSSNVE